MNVYLNYRLKVASENEGDKAKAFFEELGCEVNFDANQLFAFGVLEKHCSDEPVETVYLAKAKNTYDRFLKYMQCDTSLEGTIDTSETAGECMDFQIILSDGMINVKCSPWYIETCMDDVDDYEGFCDIVGDFSEEEYDSVKELEFVYILETEAGDKLSSDIPMFDFDL